jgi:hypothetical protein
MASNLFYLKGWAITLIAALFALSSKDTNLSYFFIVYFPVFIFWILDGYFLSQERLYRALYNDVRKLDEKDVDFSMNTEKYKQDKKNSWLQSMIAPTLLWFYIPLILAMLLIIITYLLN